MKFRKPIGNRPVLAIPLIAMLLFVSLSQNSASETGFVTLPTLAANWQELPDSKRPLFEGKIPYRWKVFENQDTGDRLSIACCPREQLPLVKYSDTALEIFPRGLAVWTHSSPNAVNEVISIGVTNQKNKANRPTLEYCFTTDASDRETLLAHGRAWFHGDLVVFVQHTATRAISAKLIGKVVRELKRSPTN